MSIKATQPEDISVIEQTVQLMRMVDAYAYDYAYTGKLASTRVELERKLRAALATPSPQPAEAKTAAEDGVTDEQINRAFLATIEAHPGELSLTALPALSFFARAIRAAIATQEGSS